MKGARIAIISDDCLMDEQSRVGVVAFSFSMQAYHHVITQYHVI